VAFAGGIGVIVFQVDADDPAPSTVTVALSGPGGETLAPAVTGTDAGHTWTAYPPYPAAGKWVATWTIDGSDIEPQIIYVSAVPTAAAVVPWRPDLWDVAAYVPRRTLVGAVDGYGSPLDTFDDTTFPRAAVVHRLITDACAWVQLAAGTIDTTLVDAARGCAAIRAAAMVESGYPDNRDDLSNADVLLKQADAMRRDLAAANVALGGDDPVTTLDNLLPVFSFPDPSPAGDLLL
jgi:hypothetical protein